MLWKLHVLLQFSTDAMLDAINEAQIAFLTNSDNPRIGFDALLSGMLKATDSDYGFIGETFQDPAGQPYLKTHAITNIAWNEETRRFYDEHAPTGLEFRNLQSLFGVVLTDHEPMIANAPSSHPRSAGLPEGHPDLNAFLGVPFLFEGELLGMAGIANRPDGYNADVLKQIQPFVTTCAVLIRALRHERRRDETQVALRRSEFGLAQAQRIAKVGSWQWTPANDQMTWSAELYRIFGVEPASMNPTRQAFLQFVHPQDRQAIADVLASAAQHGSPDHVDGRIQRLDSSIGVGHLECEAHRDEHGVVVRVVGTVQDVTEANRSREALRISEERLRQVTQIANVGIFDHDHLRDTIYWSPTQFAIYDLDPDEPITQERLLSRVHPDDRETVHATLQRNYDPDDDGSFDFEKRIVCSNGEVRWTSTRGHTYFAERDGQHILARTAGAVIDITESKRAAQMLAERAEALLKSNAELEQFAYVASHDLQEPLRKVQSFGELLEAEASEVLSPAARRYIDRMRGASARMQQLISDLLAFSHASNTDNRMVPVDLGATLHDVSEDLEVRIAESNAQIIAQSLPTVQADPFHIQQLLQNILGNALKYRRPEVAPIIRISSRRLKAKRPEHEAPGEWWEIRVSNNGIGVEAQYRERIFGVFQRLHGRGSFEGTGIGLAICRKIVERYGGRIWVEDGEDGGAAIVFELAAARAPQKDGATSI